MRLRERLTELRDPITCAGRQRGARGVRVFGAVARREQRPDSDVANGKHYRVTVRHADGVSVARTRIHIRYTVPAHECPYVIPASCVVAPDPPAEVLIET